MRISIQGFVATSLPTYIKAQFHPTHSGLKNMPRDMRYWNIGKELRGSIMSINMSSLAPRWQRRNGVTMNLSGS